MPINSEFLSRYRNLVFVETGSFIGDGIQAALDAGFKDVHSIELSPKYYDYCRVRFAMNLGLKVKLYLGDSTKALAWVIASIVTPITFWLDGHHCGDDTAFGDKSSPLMEELESIANHSIKTHTILIDDLRIWNSRDPIYGFGFDEIKAKIKAINPDYRIIQEDSARFKGDILAATIETKEGL